MSRKRRTVMAILLLSASASAGVVGQQSTADDWCRDQNWGRDREGVCEVRQYTLMAGAGPLTVDAAPNGGIEVQGTSRGDVLVEAKVVATAESQERAKEIASAVRVDAVGDKVSADGPTGLGRREGWHVSYRINVPTQMSLSLRSNNGGISVSDVEGRIEFRTTNGGVKLARLAGDVSGRTSNGGVDVDLDGATWVGSGLDVQTTNGGVRLRIPGQYSARLEVGTQNGGFDTEFPLTVQGRLDRELSATLGAGGPLIRVRTSNGGVKVMKK